MAALVEWQDEYSVGIGELDEQHKNILNIINVVLKDQQEEYDADKFSSTIASLIHHAYTHFATEERYLVQVDFPDLKQHVIDHIDFIMKTLGFALGMKKGSDKDRIDLLRYLKEWYSSHVLGLDRHYIPYLKSMKNA